MTRVKEKAGSFPFLSGAKGGKLLPSRRNEKIHCSTATVWILLFRGMLMGANSTMLSAARPARWGGAVAPAPALARGAGTRPLRPPAGGDGEVATAAQPRGHLATPPQETRSGTRGARGRQRAGRCWQRRDTPPGPRGRTCQRRSHGPAAPRLPWARLNDTGHRAAGAAAPAALPVRAAAAGPGGRQRFSSHEGGSFRPQSGRRHFRLIATTSAQQPPPR